MSLDAISNIKKNYNFALMDDSLIYELSEYLFWDVDRTTVDIEANASFVIKRVLELGQLDDWYKLVAYYGLDRILDVSKKMRALDSKALSFISSITSTPKNAFRCYLQKPSIQAHWSY